MGIVWRFLCALGTSGQAQTRNVCRPTSSLKGDMTERRHRPARWFRFLIRFLKNVASRVLTIYRHPENRISDISNGTFGKVTRAYITLDDTRCTNFPGKIGM